MAPIAAWMTAPMSPALGCASEGATGTIVNGGVKHRREPAAAVTGRGQHDLGLDPPVEPFTAGVQLHSMSGSTGFLETPSGASRLDKGNGLKSRFGTGATTKWFACKARE